MNESKNNLNKENNVIIYYALNKDTNQTEEKPRLKEFNLELKKIIGGNKASNNPKLERLKIFNEYFKYKIKKIEGRTKPTPFQIFIKEKEYIKSINDLRIQQNINPLGRRLDIINNRKANKIKKMASDTKFNVNKINNFNNSKDINNIHKQNDEKIFLKKFSPIYYFKKINNYKKNSNYYDKIKTDLYHCFINGKRKNKNKQIYQSSSGNIKKNKYEILELIRSKNLNSHIKIQNSVKNIYNLTSGNFGDENKIHNFFNTSKNKLSKEEYTNTIQHIDSKPRLRTFRDKIKFLPKNKTNKNYFKNKESFNIYKEYLKTENRIEKDTKSIYKAIFYKDEKYLNKQASFPLLKKKVDVGTNRSSFDSKNKEENKEKVQNNNKQENQVKFFISEKLI